MIDSYAACRYLMDLLQDARSKTVGSLGMTEKEVNEALLQEREQWINAKEWIEREISKHS